ncbi:MULTISPECIES: hydroxymethylglutaryl-CoA reductase, degradative [Flavobacteriaceae]|uniref:hydroxymethylglutaryl-CoA reductase, degradative n=1 Tax=Flavobacteriaceae TaxID=49546 RepID=UPI0010AE278F|nr:MULTISPECIES: hydroxymethylglutaryl-CoA reductase, degradative [Flavobacteriaceae]NJB36682.1 hydroxymethylglutaryl-CoA reductase, degradative [Croceivirga sp. JEA036]TKD60974.1 hydroxymethylglutaryl-CoA reductase, degradative [Flavobacterium sp. ASW18X]
MQQPVEGFSKLSKEEKIAWVANQCTTDPDATKALLAKYWNTDSQLQQKHDEFIENTLSNFYMPFAIAPNFLINDRLLAIPMTIEESSVVAAASKAAKFWLSRGGFKTEILGTEKIGQVHFMFQGDGKLLVSFIEKLQPIFRKDSADITKNMEKRGGGITAISLRDKTDTIPGYYQLHCTFETLDAMGANFINSCLEQFAQTLEREISQDEELKAAPFEVIMSILSNYVPNCVVRAKVSCPISDDKSNASVSRKFAERMLQAVKIAEVEPYRAVTHNKGIMNGIDAVVLATGNDFRAVEAGVHAYAAKDGHYSSLTHASIKNDMFSFWIDVPLALGTVGGLTSLHPMVQLALEILKKPSAKELMQIIAVAGLAQNFAALRSLVTTGIQKGHMKMHLLNILNSFGATTAEKEQLVKDFKDKTVSNAAVEAAINALRA